jgi:sRNA-binding regulator protein Hfq
MKLLKAGIVVLLLTLSVSLYADKIVLVNGDILSGTIVSENEYEVVFLSGDDEIAIARAAIKEIERDKPAEELPKPDRRFINLSIFPPVSTQGHLLIRGERRLNYIQFGTVAAYSTSVSGITFAPVSIVGEEMRGLQNSLLLGYSGKYMGGIQTSLLINIADGGGRGWQWGNINVATGNFRGFQFGIFNYANNFSGLQLGFINYSRNAGKQIGVINIAKDAKSRSFGLINFYGKGFTEIEIGFNTVFQANIFIKHGIRNGYFIYGLSSYPFVEPVPLFNWGFGYKLLKDSEKWKINIDIMMGVDASSIVGIFEYGYRFEGPSLQIRQRNYLEYKIRNDFSILGGFSPTFTAFSSYGYKYRSISIEISKSDYIWLAVDFFLGVQFNLR